MRLRLIGVGVEVGVEKQLPSESPMSDMSLQDQSESKLPESLFNRSLSQFRACTISCRSALIRHRTRSHQAGTRFFSLVSYVSVSGRGEGV